MEKDIIINIKNEENNEEYKPYLAVVDDIPQIKLLGASFWGKEGVYSDEFYLEALKQNLSYVYKDRVKNKNILIGVCLVRYQENSDYIGIDLLCVNKNYQGMGFGKALLSACLNKCMENGYHKFYLHVATTNSKAINLYKKFGFYKHKFVKNYYFNDKPPDNDAFMMKLYRYRKFEEIKPKKAKSLKKEETKENEKVKEEKNEKVKAEKNEKVKEEKNEKVNEEKNEKINEEKNEKVNEENSEKEEIKHVVEIKRNNNNNYYYYKNSNNYNYIQKYNNNIFNNNNIYYNNNPNYNNINDNNYNHQYYFNNYNISDYRSGYHRRLNHIFRY